MIQAGTPFVFWHATAVPKLQMPVFPVNPRLAKVGIEPIELIDDVDGQTVWKSGGNGSGAGVLPRMGWILTKHVKTQARPTGTPIS